MYVLTFNLFGNADMSRDNAKDTLRPYLDLLLEDQREAISLT